MLPSTIHAEFERIVGALPAVRETAFLTGRFDYQLRARQPASAHQSARERPELHSALAE